MSSFNCQFNKKDRLRLQQFLIISMVLVAICTGCSGGNVPCDPVCHAQKLDEKLAGDGKISLIERKSDIRKLISAYEAVLPVCSET